MAKRGPYKNRKINEKSFTAIKQLLASGTFSNTDVVKAFKISPATLYRVKNCETLEEYRRTLNEDSDRAKAKQKAKKLMAEAKASTVIYPTLPSDEMPCAISKKPFEPRISFEEANNEIVVDLLNQILAQVKIIAENTRPPRGIFHR